jgi:hypothetical protein
VQEQLLSAQLTIKRLVTEPRTRADLGSGHPSLGPVWCQEDAAKTQERATNQPYMGILNAQVLL